MKVPYLNWLIQLRILNNNKERPWNMCSFNRIYQEFVFNLGMNVTLDFNDGKSLDESSESFNLVKMATPLFAGVRSSKCLLPLFSVSKNSRIQLSSNYNQLVSNRNRAAYRSWTLIENGKM